MDIEKIQLILSQAGAAQVQIERYKEYAAAGNKKGQERILCRCRGMLNEKLQDQRKRLQCLDYMIAKVEKGHE